METSSPFRVLSPKCYIKHRYSPLYVTYVEDDVERLFKLCGVTFTDYFAAIAYEQGHPVRIAPCTFIFQEREETFFSHVADQLMCCSHPFIGPEYEETSVTNPQLSTVPSRFPSIFLYPSEDSRNPIWFRLMVETLLHSLQYSDFDFCDFPMCIIYASLSGSRAKSAADVRRALDVPPWMREFVPEIPVIRLVIYDGLMVSQPPQDCQGAKGDFDSLLGFQFRSRRSGTSGEIDPATLRKLFQYDERLLASHNLCVCLGLSDLDLARTLLRTIAALLKPKVEQFLKGMESRIEYSKQFGTRLKGLFKQKVADRLTDHLGVPHRKIVYLRLASLYFMFRQYEQARKNYKSFISSLHEGQFPELRVHAQFLSAMSSLPLPNGSHLFKEGVHDVMQVISHAKSARFLLMVLSIGSEFLAQNGEPHEAMLLCREAIDKINRLWSWNPDTKMVMLALFYERLAGLTADPRHSVFATCHAAGFYQKGNQLPHTLRCQIWALRVLPRNSWVLLYQQVRFEKAQTLCDLKDWKRALTDCKELLALPNLDVSLHETVISLFWLPFSDLSLAKDQFSVPINPLLDVRGLGMLDKTVPQCWGLAADDFHKLIFEFDGWFRNKLIITRDASFDSWWDDSQRSANLVRSVGVGDEVRLTIALPNRSRFAVLKAKYEGGWKARRTGSGSKGAAEGRAKRDWNWKSRWKSSWK
jgi:tetratricopeptide (TPR) repeat protein